VADAAVHRNGRAHPLRAVLCDAMAAYENAPVSVVHFHRLYLIFYPGRGKHRPGFRNNLVHLGARLRFLAGGKLHGAVIIQQLRSCDFALQYLRLRGQLPAGGGAFLGGCRIRLNDGENLSC